MKARTYNLQTTRWQGLELHWADAPQQSEEDCQGPGRNCEDLIHNENPEPPQLLSCPGTVEQRPKEALGRPQEDTA